MNRRGGGSESGCAPLKLEMPRGQQLQERLQAKAKAKAKATATATKKKCFAQKFAEKLAEHTKGATKLATDKVAPADKVAGATELKKPPAGSCEKAPAAKATAATELEKPPAGSCEKDPADTSGKLCGKKVKVVSLLAGAGAYQKVGKAQFHNGESDKLIIQMEASTSSGYVTTEGKFCQEFAKCSEMKSRKKLVFSQQEKLKLLVRFPGWVLEDEEEKVHTDGRDLSSRQMQMIWELIQRDVDCKGVVFPAVEDVQAVCGLCVDGKANKLTVELQKLVVQWQKPGVRKLLLPVWSCKGSAHYTLLVLEAPGEGEKEVACRYYDSLATEHAGCREIAELMRFVVKVAVASQDEESWRWELPKQVPARSMAKFQEPGSNRCGLHVLYYAEMEARETTGEIGVLPFPSWSSLQEMYIKRLVQLKTLLLKFKHLPDKLKVEAKKLEDEEAEQQINLQAVAEAAVSTSVLLEKLMCLQETYMEEKGSLLPAKYGCEKCWWKGSTCCDPDKLESKRKAQAEFAGLSWPLSTEDDEKLAASAKYDKKVYGSFLQQKKEQEMEDKKKSAMTGFKKQMGDWSSNMQQGKKLLDLAKKCAAEKKAKAEKPTAEAKEATAKEAKPTTKAEKLTAEAIILLCYTSILYIYIYIVYYPI